MKQISIVIPVYNGEKYIPALLNSIEQICYPTDKYEVIFVNEEIECFNKNPGTSKVHNGIPHDFAVFRGGLG